MRHRRSLDTERLRAAIAEIKNAKNGLHLVLIRERLLSQTENTFQRDHLKAEAALVKQQKGW